MPTERRTSVNLRIERSPDVIDAVTVEFTPNASIGDMRRALTADGPPNAYETPSVLVDKQLTARFDDDVLLVDAQLRHGQLLVLDTAPANFFATLPTVSSDDVLRLIHENGPQLAYAWPFAPHWPVVQWDLDDDLGSVRVPQDPTQPHVSFTLRQIDSDAAASDDDQPLPAEQRAYLDVAVERQDLHLEVNGRGVGKSAAVFAGSRLLIVGSSLVEPIELVVATQDDHQHTRNMNGAIPYRARPPDELIPEVEPLHERLSPPVPSPDEQWDSVDHLLLEGSMVGMYVFFIFRGGFSLTALLFGAPLAMLPVLRVISQYRKYLRRGSERIKSYKDAVANFDRAIGRLAEQVAKEAMTIFARNPDLGRMLVESRKRGRLLWQRRPGRPSFLRIAIGRGIYASPSQFEISDSDNDPHVSVWKQDAESVRFLSDAPIEYDFKDGDLAIVGDILEVYSFASDLMLRMLFQHSPSNLAAAVFLPSNSAERHRLSWLRWLPHLSVSTDLMSGRRFAFGPKACADTVQASIELLRDVDASDLERIVILVHEGSGVDAGMLERYRDMAPDHISLVWIGASKTRIPRWFERWIEIDGRSGDGSLVEARLMPGDEPLLCRIEPVSPLFESTAAESACLVEEGAGASSQAIANVVPLGNVAERVGTGRTSSWRSSSDSLIAVLGEDASGMFELDFTEDGPHVLVAGTTGSGKSELLRTLVFSLATRYLPQDLVFIFIDFKGGASLGDLGRLPHSVGVVTNLGSIDVERLLQFLQREVERRQEVLAPFNGDFGRFRRSGQHMARLLVVIDEFAGFVSSDKSGRREQSILNIAARGRSLGIHLVIATQSPKGVVSSAVLANVNARIALRVQDAADSVSILDDPIAASIQRVLKGRAVARLDNGNLRPFQSGWSETSRLDDRTTSVVSVRAFDPLASESTSSVGPGRKLRTDAEVLLASLETLTTPDEMTQPRLARSLTTGPDRITAGVRRPRLDVDPVVEISEVMLGVEDLPGRQVQQDSYLALGRGGLLMLGGATSGRTHALAAAAIDFVLHHERCQIIVLDCADGDLIRLLPGVSLAIDGTDRAMVAHVLAQLEESYGERTAPVLVLIDRIDILQDVVSDLTKLARLISNGGRRGIYFAASQDSRLPIEKDLSRAFRYRFEFLSGYQGLLQSSDEEAVLLQIADPTNCRLASEHLQVPASADFPARREYHTPNQWRPLGLAGGFAGLVPSTNNEEPGVFLGVDEVRHESVRLAIQSGLAICGPPGSGRTATLLTVCRRIFARSNGLRVPLIVNSKAELPNFMPDGSLPWWFDLRSEMDRFRANTGGGYVTDLILDRPDIANMIAVDGIDQLWSLLGHLPAERLTEFATEANARLKVGELRIAAVGPLETFVGLSIPPIGAEQLSYRNQLLHLNPPPIHLMRAWSGITGQAQNLIANISERAYERSEGIYVNNGRRREVHVVEDNDALLFIREYLDVGPEKPW